MAETATIARPYAEAAFALATDKGDGLAAWSDTLARLAAVAASAEVRRLVGNPRLSSEQLTDLLLAAVSNASAEARNFVATLVENKRVEALPAVHEIFETLKNEREGTVDTLIESAYPLNDGQLAELQADLERRFKRKIRPEVKVDPELIGGVRISVGDEVIDGSVRGRLNAMESALKS